MSGAVIPLLSNTPGFVNFPDFVNIMLAVKDKMNGFSAQFWYRCISAEVWDLATLSAHTSSKLAQLSQTEASSIQISCMDAGPKSMQLSTEALHGSMMQELMDMLPDLKSTGTVSCLTIRKAKLGSMVFTLLFDPIQSG